MIDLHSHVLAGIDDGAPDMESSVALAAAAAEAGVTVLAATPHVRADHPRVRPAELGDRAAALRTELERAGVPIEIVVAGEADLYWAAHAGDGELALVSYGQRGGDLLVETPYGELPPAFEELLFGLVARGFRVLLAHPERSPTFRREPRRLAALVETGTLLQVTATTLTGPRGSRAHGFAVRLVREGLAHAIASDAHSADDGRSAGLAAAVAVADRHAPGRGHWMTTDVPAAILAGEPLPPAPALRRRRLGRLLRH